MKIEDLGGKKALDTSYDPYSQAEMQMKVLLSPQPSIASTGLGGVGMAGFSMGSTTTIEDPLKPKISRLNSTATDYSTYEGFRADAKSSIGSSISQQYSPSPKIDYGGTSARVWNYGVGSPKVRRSSDRWSPAPPSPNINAWSSNRSSPSRLACIP